MAAAPPHDLPRDETTEPFRADVAAARTRRDLITVAGADAETYLQGQLSQDVSQLAVVGPSWSLLLEPTGKMCAWLRVGRLGAQQFVLDLDPGSGPTALERLQRFKLRTKADLELEPDVPCVSVRGPNLAAVDLASVDAQLVVPADWPGVAGVDLIGPGVDVPAGVTEVGLDALDALRIECGVPAMGRELTDATIPAEAGQWLVDTSASFTKGCYTGQELVARIDSRGGNVPRHLRLIWSASGEAPAVGAEVVVDGKAVGSLTSVAARARGWVALAFVARAVEPPVSAAVADQPAEVVGLPPA